MSEFATDLLNWFDQFGRKDLPWQLNRTPYRVWVSEIMLQQTQVKTVIPYFERFMDRFPSVDQLASASTDEVMHQWTGLGYYARARNLHKTAQTLMTDYNGEFPMEPEELESLPGIGRSTANAIVAQCTGQRAVILDGNVKRVLSRFFAIGGWPGQSNTQTVLWERADQLTPDARVTDYTQAIMDLGAMVCTRSKPACDVCPVRKNCVARKSNRIAEFPNRKPKKALPVKTTAMLYIESKGNVLLEKRPAEGIWGGLWSLPQCDYAEIEACLAERGIFENEIQELQAFRHSFTHYHLDITPIFIKTNAADQVREDERRLWLDPSRPEEIGLSKPALTLIQQLGTIR